jgi:hypothetical protein
LFARGYSNAFRDWGARLLVVHSIEHINYKHWNVMGDLCMRFLTQIVSFFVWIIGTITSIASKISPIIDDSISLLAGLIGIIGGIVWISTLALKKKENVINLENAKLENEIKKKQLDNLENDS